MCGIAGFLRSPGSPDDLRASLAAMSHALRHRGPDGDGVWLDPAVGLGLAHRRLAILDLSPTGRQPMISPGGRFSVTYNGEIYNFRDLRRDLEADFGVPFRSTSDTEVLLAAVEAWGLDRALSRLIGMFAFALWDGREQTLHLVRDRLGIKPLYYGWAGSTFLFASELAGLLAHPGFDPTLDRDALVSYLGCGYVAAPHAICRDARKLEPGTILSVRPSEPGRTETRRFWDVRETAARSLAEPWMGSDEDGVEMLEARLEEAVALRLVSDVPVGAFLSGGVDSSTVVALVESGARGRLETFSIGSPDPAYDEMQFARRVSQHLGTRHHELPVGEAQLQAAIREFPRLLSEPLADASLIPAWLVSSLARLDVKVALSGDGGDELFAGYNRYGWGVGAWERQARFPEAARRAGAAMLAGVSPQAWDRWVGTVGRFLPARHRVPRPGEKIHKFAALLGADSEVALIGDALAHWRDPHTLVLGSGGGRGPADVLESARYPGTLERLMLRDLLVYLPDDVLAKVDRASMAVGLEARVPLLDHRIVELAWRLPPRLKMRKAEGKWILRRVLERHLPAEFVARPKMGFAVPLGDWLRGPLREWGESLLDPTTLRGQGVFDVERVRRTWELHQDRRREAAEALWDVLVFQIWLETWGRGRPARSG